MDDRHHNPSSFNRTNGESGGDTPDRYGPVNDEWVSAYLDGECTADERAEAEARIAASAELRQLVDDLRNVRTSMEVLPQHRLDPAFAERVLRRAEREMLTGGGSSRAAPPTAAPAEGGSSGVVNIPAAGERLGGARPFVWSLAALAAAILILVTNREAPVRNDGVARGPNAPTAQMDEGAAGSSNERGRDFDSPNAADERRIADTEPSRSVRPATAKDAELRPRRPADSGTKSAVQANAVPPEAPSLNTSDDRIRYGSAQEDPQGPLEPSLRPDTARLQARKSLASGAEPQPAQAPAATPALGESIAAPSTNEADNSEAGANEAANSEAANKKAAAADAKQLADTPVVNVRPAEQAPPIGNDARIANGTYAFSLSVPREPLRVVQLQVERDAWERREIENVFAQNSIALFDTEGLQLTSPYSNQSAQDKVASADAFEAAGRASLAKKEAQSDSLELLVVTAPSAQVEAALEDFQQQKEFRIVQMTDAIAPQQFYEKSVTSLGLQVPGQANGGLGGATPGDQAPAPDASRKELAVPDREEEIEAKDLRESFGAAASSRAAIGQQDADQLSSQRAGAQQGLRARRFAAPQAEAASGGRGISAQNAQTQRLGGGYGLGGYTAGGYGATGNLSDGAAGQPPADAAQTDVAIGYGQRVTLEPPPSATSAAATNDYSRGGLRLDRGTAAQTPNNVVTANTQERVLFFFRIVDTPLASESAAGSTAAGSTAAGSTAAGSTTAGSSPSPAKDPSAGTKADPKADAVPVPAPAAGSPR